jgi:SecY
MFRIVRIRASPLAPRRIPEFWRKTGLALATLLVCEVGARIVAPGLNPQALRDLLQAGSASWLLRLYDWVVGGALSRGAVLGLGIAPYVSARIFMRLSRVVTPRLAALWEAETGRAKLARATRWLAGGLALVQSYGFARFVEGIPGAVAHPGFGFLARTMAVLTSGAIGVMLLSEQLTRSPRDDLLRDDATATHEDATADEPRSDQPADVPSLEPATGDTPLLSSGQRPEVEWHRPKREGAPVRRESKNAERSSD